MSTTGQMIDKAELIAWLIKQRTDTDWPYEHRHAFGVVIRVVEKGEFDIKELIPCPIPNPEGSTARRVRTVGD